MQQYPVQGIPRGEGPRSILAVMVLYKMLAEESPAFLSLRELLRRNQHAAQTISLILCDNTPWEQQPPAAFEGLYVSDITNPGLAKCYNLALRAAQERHIQWLLLLDQDTQLTSEYLDELLVLSQTLAANERIVGIAPKLVAGTHVYSPHGPCYRGPLAIPQLDSYGIFGGILRVFNSGALVRVSALQAVGGFPEEYWLDYLDHATFHPMQQRGGDFFIMHAQLSHDLSFHRPDKHSDPANAARHRNQLRAQLRFYQQHGAPGEQLRLRLDLLKDTLKSLLRGHPAEAQRFMRAALSLPMRLAR